MRRAARDGSSLFLRRVHVIHGQVSGLPQLSYSDMHVDRCAVKHGGDHRLEEAPDLEITGYDVIADLDRVKPGPLTPLGEHETRRVVSVAERRETRGRRADIFL